MLIITKFNTMTEHKQRIETAIVGALCLIIGWGVGTFLHECCHLAGAYAYGVPATLELCILSTGFVLLYGDLTATQTTVITLAGSLGLVIVGVLMVRLSGVPAVRMIGVVFLCRAWIDTLPICGYDGGVIAGSAGYGLAMLIVLAEILICGNEIIRIIPAEISR